MYKILLTIFLIIYIISPIDVAPGPIDDIIVTLIGITATRKSGNSN